MFIICDRDVLATPRLTGHKFANFDTIFFLFVVTVNFPKQIKRIFLINYLKFNAATVEMDLPD